LTTRLNILPDPAFSELQAGLSERLARLAASIDAEQFGALADPLMREVFQSGVAEAGAHEGTIWLVDDAGEFLVPAINTGPRAEQMVGRFRQPLNSGLICMVFASEQPFLENEVSKSPDQSKLLDSLLQVETTALIAVPFYFVRACRGVISCVQLARDGSHQAGASQGFRPHHLACMQRTASILSQLIEYQLLSSAVGWKCR
jgi:hypothetical protein